MNRTEPIRKPFNQQKFKLCQHQRLARSIDGRIFQLGGTLYLVTREPQFEALIESMFKLSAGADRPRCILQEIAFTSGSDGQLTKGILGQISHSLGSWRNHLIKTRRQNTLKRELAEVIRLEKRVQLCTATLKNGPLTTAFMVSAEQQLSLKKTLSNYNGERLSQFERYLARLVCWFSGARAVERYVDALVNTPTFEADKLNRIDSMIAWLQTLQHRSTFQSHWLMRHEFKNCQHFRELIRWIRQTHFDWPDNSVTFLSKLAGAVQNLAAIRSQIVERVEHDFPITLAAWAICDHGTNRLPIHLIRSSRRRLRIESLKHAASHHVAVSDRSGYDRWLGMLNAEQLKGSRRNRFAALRMLTRGDSAADVRYVGQAIKLKLIGRNVKLAHARELIIRIRRVMGTPTGEIDSGLNRLFCTAQAVQIGRRVFQWLDSFSNSAISPRVKNIVISLLDEIGPTFDTRVLGPMILERTKVWADRQSAVRIAFENETNWPTDARRWIRRLNHFQRLTGQQPRVPKSVERPLDNHEKREKEFAYLNRQLETGAITPVQQSRLNYLCSNQIKPAMSGKKERIRVVNSAQEACLRSGLEALRQIFCDVANSVWSHHSGNEVSSWSLSRRITMALWVCQMKPLELNLFKQINTAWKEHGDKYKRHLSFNEAWIRESRCEFRKLKCWLNPKPSSVKINGQQILFRVIDNPFEVYFMGTYFNTCLSQGGCNEMSVLANAAHANKQVVYAYTKDGTVVARQLIAINTDFKLVGFDTYMNLVDTGLDSNLLIKQLEAYARQISTRCGIKMADEDEPCAPKNLGNHVWYDDGTVSWSSQ